MGGFIRQEEHGSRSSQNDCNQTLMGKQLLPRLQLKPRLGANICAVILSNQGVV
jgi:hypothetical protein